MQRNAFQDDGRAFHGLRTNGKAHRAKPDLPKHLRSFLLVLCCHSTHLKPGYSPPESHCQPHFIMARGDRQSEIPHHARSTTPPTHRTLTPQPLSRLPRRLATPSSATPTSRLASSSVAERIANAERAASKSRSPLDIKQGTPSSRLSNKVRRDVLS